MFILPLNLVPLRIIYLIFAPQNCRTFSKFHFITAIFIIVYKLKNLTLNKRIPAIFSNLVGILLAIRRIKGMVLPSSLQSIILVGSTQRNRPPVSSIVILR